MERIYRLNGGTEMPALIDSLNIPKGYETESVSAMSFIRRPAVLVNLIVMTYFWASSSFDYYLTTFMLKYLNGDVFSNVYASVLAEIFGTLCCGILVQK